MKTMDEEIKRARLRVAGARVQIAIRKADGKGQDKERYALKVAEDDLRSLLFSYRHVRRTK